MSTITLITGGARSGKSSHALALAQSASSKAFIATAVALDQEMTERIKKHQSERGSDFITIEEPYALASAIHAIPEDTQIAVIDCLTVWLGNVMHREELSGASHQDEIDNLIEAMDTPPCDLVIVTNEVGMGIVPEYPMARAFRDSAGRLNERIARRADHVVLMVCGIPLTIK